MLAWDYQRNSAKDEARKAKDLDYRADVDGQFSGIKHVRFLPPFPFNLPISFGAQ